MVSNSFEVVDNDVFWFVCLYCLDSRTFFLLSQRKIFFHSSAILCFRWNVERKKQKAKRKGKMRSLM